MNDKYNPLKEISITGRPSVSFGLTTQGDFFGYTSLSATDLLGDHRLTLTLGSYYGYRTFSLTYLNLKNRLHYYASVFSFTIPYYTSYDYSRSITIRKQFGLRAGIHLPFNRSKRLELGMSFPQAGREYGSYVIWCQVTIWTIFYRLGYTYLIVPCKRFYPFFKQESKPW